MVRFNTQFTAITSHYVISIFMVLHKPDFPFLTLSHQFPKCKSRKTLLFTILDVRKVQPHNSNDFCFLYFTKITQITDDIFILLVFFSLLLLLLLPFDLFLLFSFVDCDCIGVRLCALAVSHSISHSLTDTHSHTFRR